MTGSYIELRSQEEPARWQMKPAGEAYLPDFLK
jgi:hypothetical protein